MKLSVNYAEIITLAKEKTGKEITLTTLNDKTVKVGYMCRYSIGEYLSRESFEIQEKGMQASITPIIMKKLIFTLLLTCSITLHAQHLLFKGVNMHMPLQEFVVALEARDCHYYHVEDTYALMSGNVFGATPHYFCVHQNFGSYVHSIDLGYAFKNQKEADAFRTILLNTIKKEYPMLNSRKEQTWYNFEGDEGDISIFSGKKNEFAGGDVIYPLETTYVVSVNINDSQRPHRIDYEITNDDTHEVAVVKCVIDKNSKDEYEKDFFSITVPETITLQGEQYMVTTIGENAFSYCDQLQSINMPKTIINIKKNAFYGCDGLKSVFLPKNVKEIAPSAFWNSHNITRIDVDEENPYLCSKDGIVFSKDMKTLICMPQGFSGAYNLPKGVKHLAEHSMVADNLTSVVLPEGLETIGDEAFFWDKNLRNINFPSTLRSIGETAFLKCQLLESIILPEGLKDISRSTFSDCSSIQVLTLPSSLKNIGESAFYGIGYKGMVNIPDSVISIGEKAFSFSSCTHFHIPSSLIFLGNEAFSYSKADFSVSKENAYFFSENGALYDKEKTTLIAFPNNCKSNIVIDKGIKSIANGAFMGNRKILRITLPETLQTIGNKAFEFCDNLLEVSIPENIIEIGEKAFSMCYHLKSVTLPTPTSIKRIGPYFVGDNTSVYVPDENLDFYKESGIIIKDDRYFAKNISIEPISTYKPLEYREPSDLADKMFACIKVKDDVWTLTVDRIKEYCKEVDLVENPRFTNNCITNQSFELLKIESLNEDFIINFSRINYDENRKCISTESAIDCIGYEEAVADYIYSKLKKGRKLIQKNDRHSYIIQKKDTVTFIIPEKSRGLVFIVNVQTNSPLYEQLVSKM